MGSYIQHIPLCIFKYFAAISMSLSEVGQKTDTACKDTEEGSRDRIVVSTLRCGRSNPGSNPGHGKTG